MSAQADPLTNEERIRALIRSHHTAIRDHDAAGALAAYARDPVLYDLAPPLRLRTSGPEELEAWFATWSGPIALKHDDLHVEIDGDLALAYGFLHMTGRRTDGEVTDLWMRQTLALRNIAGEWRIAHEHTSVPFHMDGSYRAAIDLEP